MISINEIYETVQNLAQKQQHGAITVTEFNKYANMASIDLFNERIGSIRDYYRLGKAISKSSAGMNKEVDQSLRPFLISNNVIVIVAGQGTLPTDCEYIDMITYNNKALKWVPTNKIPSYLNSTIDVPTLDYPIYTDLTTSVQVYPSGIPNISLNYYKTPQSVKWNYTLVGGRPVYSSTGSVDFEWYATQKLDLIMRICGYVGITIRDAELTQYSEQQENTIA